MQPFLIFLSIAILIFILTFPWTIVLETNELQERDINIIENSLVIEKLLLNHKNIFTEDEYQIYKGYIYKVLTYSTHYIVDNELSYLSIISTAIIYHDYHILSNRLDIALEEYSIEDGSETVTISKLDQICNYARANLNGVYNEEELILLTNIIQNYDNIINLNDNIKINVNSNNFNIINSVRKAGWILRSSGIINYGMPYDYINRINNKIYSDNDYLKYWMNK